MKEINKNNEKLTFLVDDIYSLDNQYDIKLWSEVLSNLAGGSGGGSASGSGGGESSETSLQKCIFINSSNGTNTRFYFRLNENFRWFEPIRMNLSFALTKRYSWDSIDENETYNVGFAVNIFLISENAQTQQIDETQYFSFNIKPTEFDTIFTKQFIPFSLVPKNFSNNSFVVVEIKRVESWMFHPSVDSDFGALYLFSVDVYQDKIKDKPEFISPSYDNWIFENPNSFNIKTTKFESTNPLISHESTEWEITNMFDSIIWTNTSSIVEELTNIDVNLPEETLQHNTTYKLRVRYKTNNQVWLPWSDYINFSAEEAPAW